MANTYKLTLDCIKKLFHKSEDASRVCQLLVADTYTQPWPLAALELIECSTHLKNINFAVHFFISSFLHFPFPHFPFLLFISTLLLLHLQGLPSEYTQNTIVSLWKPPVDNIDSWMLLCCIHRATVLLIVPCRPFEAAYYSHGQGHCQPCQWAVCCNVQVQRCQEIETFQLGSNGFWLPPTRTHGRTQGQM